MGNGCRVIEVVKEVFEFDLVFIFRVVNNVFIGVLIFCFFSSFIDFGGWCLV